ncbi:tetratricopeptide repeat protein [Flavobacterium cyanobacteriorum]|uniref:tetratricopeptide repeat protein n=1 Tax=Flavobacterium cyanobacteriorum TaxID=2022802 RepID=UPI001FAECDC9|nr:tetratricopeptide repeat protein [Flavobacterium cyanobacteriorum]
MRNLKVIGFALLAFNAVTAQDAEQAKKAIDAEQYQKAKTILKSLIASSPDEGKNYFLLGDVYLRQKEADSAAIYFNRGKAVKNNPEYNTIGLGQIDLNSGNAAAAQSKFDAVTGALKKKDVEQLIYIGRAYINAEKPDYKKAIAVLNNAVARDPKNAQAHLSLGDAYYGDRDQNEAYKSYRNALLYDKSLVRAELQLAVITKNTGAAFPEAVKAFNTIVAASPNYGPVYRELAETYYYWGKKEPAKYSEYTKKALEYYEKYMSLTDYSLNSRMRHADFLLLAGDYKALEAEAQKMQQMDKVNPVILRYLAYSSYENGNYNASLKAINEFIAKVDPKRVIARDYLYLGLAQLAIAAEGAAPVSSVVTSKDGAVTTTDSKGNTSTVSSDGTVTTRDSKGNETIISKDGTVTTRDSKGNVAIISKDGTVTTSGAGKVNTLGSSQPTSTQLVELAIQNLKKAVEKDPKIANEYNDIGKKLFAQKLYGPASAVFEVAAASPDNKNAFYDNFYLGYSIFFDHVNKSPEAKKANKAQLEKADAALAKVIELSAESQDAHLYRAKVNQQLQTPESYAVMGTHYDEYIKIVTAKGTAETSKASVIKNLIEAYSNAGAYYAVTDKPKAKEYFNKVLQLDPNDQYAKTQLSKL